LLGEVAFWQLMGRYASVALSLDNALEEGGALFAGIWQFGINSTIIVWCIGRMQYQLGQERFPYQ